MRGFLEKVGTVLASGYSGDEGVVFEEIVFENIRGVVEGGYGGSFVETVFGQDIVDKDRVGNGNRSRIKSSSACKNSS